MRYHVNVPGFEGQNTEVQVSFWTGSKLLLNGQPARNGSQRGEFVLLRGDGSAATVSLKPQLFGLDVPQVVVDGQVTNLVEPLKWYQWLWAGLPILLLFIGGALGAVAGMVSFAISARIYRLELNGFLKYLLVGVVSALAVVVYFVGAILVSMLLRS